MLATFCHVGKVFFSVEWRFMQHATMELPLIICLGNGKPSEGKTEVTGVVRVLKLRETDTGCDILTALEEVEVGAAAEAGSTLCGTGGDISITNKSNAGNNKK